jgi:hypothetical protein
VASSAAGPLPTFRTAWTVSAGTVSPSPGFDSDRRLAVDLVLERSLEDVDDLLTGVLVPDERRLRTDVDAVLDYFAPRNPKIVPLHIGAEEPWRLLDGGGHVCLLRLVVVRSRIARSSAGRARRRHWYEARVLDVPSTSERSRRSGGALPQNPGVKSSGSDRRDG